MGWQDWKGLEGQKKLRAPVCGEACEESRRGRCRLHPTPPWSNMYCSLRPSGERGANLEFPAGKRLGGFKNSVQDTAKLRDEGQDNLVRDLSRPEEPRPNGLLCELPGALRAGPVLVQGVRTRRYQGGRGNLLGVGVRPPVRRLLLLDWYWLCILAVFLVSIGISRKNRKEGAQLLRFRNRLKVSPLVTFFLTSSVEGGR